MGGHSRSAVARGRSGGALVSPTLLQASKDALGLGCCDWRRVVLSLSLGQHRMDSPSAIGEDSSCFCGGSEESSTTGPGQRHDETAVGPG